LNSGVPKQYMIASLSLIDCMRFPGNFHYQAHGLPSVWRALVPISMTPLRPTRSGPMVRANFQVSGVRHVRAQEYP
jgi:hypothetical protein